MTATDWLALAVPSCGAFLMLAAAIVDVLTTARRAARQPSILIPTTNTRPTDRWRQ
jgi:hypothetical protein